MGWMNDFYRSSIGKKVAVAVTGVILYLFLIIHMLGNLQVFEGRGPTVETTKLNEYAELLRFEMGVLWAFRAVLVAAAVLHFVTVLQLTRQNLAARPRAYAARKAQASTFASRTMLLGGFFILVFVPYHIMHFTTRTVHASLLPEGDVYGGVVNSFRNPLIVLAYLVAQAALFFHLKHGITSSTETLGVNHPRCAELARRGGPLLAAVITLGFIAVPVAVWLGLVE